MKPYSTTTTSVYTEISNGEASVAKIQSTYDVSIYVHLKNLNRKKFESRSSNGIYAHPHSLSLPKRHYFLLRSKNDSIVDYMYNGDKLELSTQILYHLALGKINQKNN